MQSGFEFESVRFDSERLIKYQVVARSDAAETFEFRPMNVEYSRRIRWKTYRNVRWVDLIVWMNTLPIRLAAYSKQIDYWFSKTEIPILIFDYEKVEKQLILRNYDFIEWTNIINKKLKSFKDRREKFDILIKKDS